MKYRPLPIVEQLTKADPADALAARNAMAEELFRTPGIQLVASILESVETSALANLQAGSRPEYNCGCLSAVQVIRNALLALLPDPQSEGSEYLQGQVEEPYVMYESGFNIPYPRANGATNG